MQTRDNKYPSTMRLNSTRRCSDMVVIVTFDDEKFMTNKNKNKNNKQAIIFFLLGLVCRLERKGVRQQHDKRKRAREKRNKKFFCPGFFFPDMLVKN